MLLTVHVQALASRDVAADARAEKQLVALLTIPLESYDVVTVLGLGRYPALMGLLQLSMRKEMAVKIVQSILKNDTKVCDQCCCMLGSKDSMRYVVATLSPAILHMCDVKFTIALEVRLLAVPRS